MTHLQPRHVDQFLNDRLHRARGGDDAFAPLVHLLGCVGRADVRRLALNQLGVQTNPGQRPGQIV